MDFEDSVFEPDGRTLDSAIQLVERQAELLISVATGGPDIDQVEGKYRERDLLLRRASRRWGIAVPFPWRSLWDWYGFWSGKLGRWHERRSYIRGLADKAIEQLESLKDPSLVDTGATGGKTLETVEARIEGLRERLATARNLDDFQDLGRRSREVLIAAVDKVFDPDWVPFDEEPPKRADAKARFDLILENKFVGSSRAETRNFMRSAWELANKVTHAGTNDRLAECRQDALAAAQGALAIVRVLSELTRESESS